MDEQPCSIGGRNLVVARFSLIAAKSALGAREQERFLLFL